MKNFICILITGVWITAALPCAADLFSSKDDAFSLDMPAGWTRVSNPPAQSVLSIRKGDARLDVKKIECTRENCLDQAINRDLAEIKSKQMTVIKNTYTGDEIKRIEFSTGEPFYYVSFYTPKNDFSAGYFLVNGQGYSVLSKNITYAETDLIFAAIAPTAVVDAPLPSNEPSEEISDVDLLRSYDTAVSPDVEVENLQTVQPAPTTPTRQGMFSRMGQYLKRYNQKFAKYTLLSVQMPPYIRALGRGYDLLVCLLMLFFIVWVSAGVVRIFVRPVYIEIPANPNSLYPIRMKRLYGTPSLIFRARDNQGNILTALNTRWDALLMFCGIILMLLAFLAMTATSACQLSHLLPAGGTFIYNILYSSTSLILPIGFLIFFCGVVWGQVAMTDITLYDRSGKKAAIILQKGYSLFDERYQIYFARSKELLLAERKRFAIRRQWKLMSKDHIEFATLEETSTLRAWARMWCGHLWGMLRADYRIKGVMESSGTLQNTHALFNQMVCNIDKPEAVNARDLLAISLLIAIRDRDKWYPWFN